MGSLCRAGSSVSLHGDFVKCGTVCDWCGEKALSGDGDKYLRGMREGEELQSTDGNGKRLVNVLQCGTM